MASTGDKYNCVEAIPIPLHAPEQVAVASVPTAQQVGGVTAYAYVSQNHRILRVALPTGQIEILAGSVGWKMTHQRSWIACLRDNFTPH
eukprot:SAG31_NODE_998_length_10460_cov_255.143505_11_plen_89_part_00